jgi:hypothetical protein
MSKLEKGGGGALVGEYAYTWCTTAYNISIMSLLIISEPTASVTLHLLWPWLQLVPHTGWMIRKGTLRRPGATGRGAVGQYAISQELMLGTGVASGFYHCLSLHIGATVRNGAEASLSGTARQHPRQCSRGQLLTQHLGHLLSPPDAIALVPEQMALINAQFDAHAIESAARRQRDALRDIPRPMQATKTPI